jgi:hypothetical protein
MADRKTREARDPDVASRSSRSPRGECLLGPAPKQTAARRMTEVSSEPKICAFGPECRIGRRRLVRWTADRGATGRCLQFEPASEHATLEAAGRVRLDRCCAKDELREQRHPRRPLLQRANGEVSIGQIRARQASPTERDQQGESLLAALPLCQAEAAQDLMWPRRFRLGRTRSEDVGGVVFPAAGVDVAGEDALVLVASGRGDLGGMVPVAGGLGRVSGAE